MSHESKNLFGRVTLESILVGDDKLLDDRDEDLITDITSTGDALDAPVDALPPGVEARLKVVAGTRSGEAIPLDKPVNSLGRGQTNDIVFKQAQVSCHHATISFTKQMEWRIDDLGSTNGTLLNGSRVKGFALHAGDKLLIGDSLMVFTVDEAG